MISLKFKFVYVFILLYNGDSAKLIFNVKPPNRDCIRLRIRGKRLGSGYIKTIRIRIPFPPLRKKRSMTECSAHESVPVYAYAPTTTKHFILKFPENNNKLCIVFAFLRGKISKEN